MKVTLKSPNLDLEIEDAPSLDEVLKFIEAFHELNLKKQKSDNELTFQMAEMASKVKRARSK